MNSDKNLETVTFANGCFWCKEAVFQQLKGVEKVTSGYSGGHLTSGLIFYHNEEQKEKAEKYKAALDKSHVFDSSVVTAIEPLKIFYPAENCHTDYYKNHPTQSYCYYIIKPKLDKLKKVFAGKLKPTLQV
jgi:peptide methionine sulfoxide reductase MsrA